jgi:hypothetical protein
MQIFGSAGAKVLFDAGVKYLAAIFGIQVLPVP